MIGVLRTHNTTFFHDIIYMYRLGTFNAPPPQRTAVNGALRAHPSSSGEQMCNIYLFWRGGGVEGANDPRHFISLIKFYSSWRNKLLLSSTPTRPVTGTASPIPPCRQQPRLTCGRPRHLCWPLGQRPRLTCGRPRRLNWPLGQRPRLTCGRPRRLNWPPGRQHCPGSRLSALARAADWPGG